MGVILAKKYSFDLLKKKNRKQADPIKNLFFFPDSTIVPYPNAYESPEKGTPMIC